MHPRSASARCCFGFSSVYILYYMYYICSMYFNIQHTRVSSLASALQFARSSTAQPTPTFTSSPHTMYVSVCVRECVCVCVSCRLVQHKPSLNLCCVPWRTFKCTVRTRYHVALYAREPTTTGTHTHAHTHRCGAGHLPLENVTGLSALTGDAWSVCICTVYTL